MTALALVHHGAQVAYWNILRNAHTSMQRLLISSGFESNQVPEHEVPTDYRNLAILRDPVDRYLSAVYLMWQLRGDGRPLADYVNAQASTATGWFWTCGDDPHFAAQVEQVPRRAVVFYPIDQLPRAMEWLVAHGVEVSAPLTHERRMPLEARAVFDDWRRRYPERVQAILDAYSLDWILWNQADASNAATITV